MNASQPPAGRGPVQQENNAPLILGILGIVGWFVCAGIPGIVLGLIGQSKARELGQSQTLPRIAWIGGLVALALVVGGALLAQGTRPDGS